jgi:hypothetical protein
VLNAAPHSEFDGVRVDGSRVGVRRPFAWRLYCPRTGRRMAVLEGPAHPGGARAFAVLVAIHKQKQQANPVMYQGGARDSRITPTAKKGGGAYDQSAKPKYYIELDGAGHLAWTNLNRTYVASIDAYCVAFFDAYLKGPEGRPDQTVKCRPSQGRQRFTLCRAGLVTRSAVCATP